MTVELKPNPSGTLEIAPVRQQIDGVFAEFPGIQDDEMVQDASGEWVWRGQAAESTLPAEIAADLASISTADLAKTVARKPGRK